jgi:hypothetical protein
VIIGELQGVNDPQNFIKVSAGAGRIGDLEPQLFVGIDDEN